MPEGPEILLLGQYLSTQLKNKILTNVTVLSGKYLKNSLPGLHLLQQKSYTIKGIKSKGKFMWFILCDVDEPTKYVYLTSHCGLKGLWSFNEHKHDRLVMSIDPSLKLYYNDSIGYGSIEIIDNIYELEKRQDYLAPDAIQTPLTQQKFIKALNAFINRSDNIYKILMNQTSKYGVVSGLGNYLVSEILYDAKINPHKTIKEMTRDNMVTLHNSIDIITQLSYKNNNTEYTKEFVAKSTTPFEYNVYKKSKHTSIITGRTVYWVPSVQI